MWGSQGVLNKPGGRNKKYRPAEVGRMGFPPFPRGRGAPETPRVPLWKGRILTQHFGTRKFGKPYPRGQDEARGKLWWGSVPFSDVKNRS
ncbi:hypothetical protein JTE90_011981 [Oedothorax gibbosus]|uniref:Uncharacterized protein n=1 Tax=Oedothorax gibbosus TaxID=931172 RepID=A0AAV6TGA1_9ARAC|nr:hypothetical protein JTE90_011981 [Oedothorax gibbosus]